MPENNMPATDVLEQMTAIESEVEGGFLAFIEQAEQEADDYADSLYGTDPKPGDIDELRNAMEHAYVSGRLVQEGYGDLANLSGVAREAYQTESSQEHSKDHWNNREGREAGDATANETNKKDALAEYLWDRFGDVNDNGQIDQGEVATSPTGDLPGNDDDYTPPTYDPLFDLENVTLLEIVGEQLGAVAKVLYDDILPSFSDVFDHAKMWLDDLADNGDGSSSPDGESPPPSPELPFPLKIIQEIQDLLPKSPLVLDVDHSETVELSALGDTGTYFDLDGDGQAELTAWVTGGDGLLARDLNANGNIDDIAELFGTSGGAEDGFASLRALDTNADNRITGADDDWGDLVVWVDTNMDGRTQDGELHTLDDLGIASISLDATLQEGVTINGNQITHEATFTTTADEEYAIVDAWFGYNPGMTRNIEDFEFDLRAAFLPTLRGFGGMKDLHIAASSDNGATDTVMSMLIDLSDEIGGYTSPAEVFENWTDLESAVDGLMLRWVGVDGVDPESRGAHVDAQHLEFYEAFTGQPFTQYGQPDPLIEAGAFIEAMYSYVRTYFTEQVVAQSIGADIFEEAPAYSLFTGGMTGDMDLSQDGIDAVEAVATTASDPVEVWARFAQFLGYTKGLDNLTTAEITALDAAVAATNEPSLDDWADVTATMILNLGDIIDSPDDWGSFEVYYDNIITGTASGETLTGGNNVNDQIIGLGGNDTLEGLSGHDRLSGGNGDDILDGGAGDDYADGGAGDDTYIYSGGNDTYYDVSGSDEIEVAASTGLTSADISSLFTTNANDLVIQFDTGDFITVDQHFYTQGQSFFLNGNIGRITFLSDSSYVDLGSNAAQMTFQGSDASDDIRLDSANTGMAYILYGFAGNDTLFGDDDGDEIYGGSGSDWLNGYDGNDYVDGGAGDDDVFGNVGSDILHGGDGNDDLRGFYDDDEIYGDAGNDILSGGYDDDILDGGAGNDILLGGGALEENEELEEYEYLDNDTYYASAGSDTILDGGGILDVIVFPEGVVFGDLTVSRVDNDMTIEWDANLITISGYFDDLTEVNQYANTIEELHFFDNSVAALENYIYGTPDDDDLYGTVANDVILGGAGYDYIYSSSGYDTIDGEADGGQLYYYDSGLQNGVVVNLSTGIVSDDGFGYTDTVTGITDVQGSEFDDVITGDSAENFIDAGEGEDTLDGGSGTDGVMFLQYSGDTVVSLAAGTADDGQGNTASFTNFENVVGSTYDDSITGDSGDNVLNGVIGDDTLDGGDGADTADFTSGWQGATVNLATGTASDDGFGDSDTLSNIENVIGTDHADTITGDANANELDGGAGDDTLTGGDGDDIMDGAAGTDTADYSSDGAGVTVNLSSGTATDGNSDTDTLSNIENVIGSDYDDAITGDSADNILNGSAGDDDLDGGSGNDILAGGAGDDDLHGGAGYDTASYAAASAGVSVDLSHSTAAGEGTDDLDNIENAIGTDYADTLTGSSNDNVLTGGNGDDVIYGNDGLDTIYGGEGDNTLEGGDSNDAIYGGDGVDTINGGSGLDLIYAYGGNDIVYGGSNSDVIYAGDGDDFVDGEGGGDTIYGEAGDDTLYGSDVNDRIYGGSGDDTIDGGGSNDTIDYSLDPGAVTVSMVAGTATDGWGDADTIVNFEHVTGSAYADSITGSAGGNIITAGAGNDTVTSGDGNDTLYGGDGDDTLSGENGSDTIVGGAGDDTMDGGSGTDTLSYSADIAGVTVNMAAGTATDGWGDADTISNFEHLVGSAYADTLTGSASSNQLTAGDGNDTVYAGNGSDTITGGTGDDLLYAEAGNDTFISGVGDDTFDGGSDADTVSFVSDIAGVTASLTSATATDGWGDADTFVGIENLTGSAYNDTLTGGSAANTLSGGGGNDTLYGKGGLDVLTGGAGADTFVFEAASAFNNVDTVNDFSTGASDVIDIADVLDGYFTSGVDDITEFVQITDNGTDSALAIDQDGTANGTNFVAVASILGVTGLTDEAALETSGTLLAA